MNTESISPITPHVHPFLQVMSPIYGRQVAKAAPASARQARAAPGGGASPARSLRAATAVEDAPANERGSAKGDKILAMFDALS